MFRKINKDKCFTSFDFSTYWQTLISTSQVFIFLIFLIRDFPLKKIKEGYNLCVIIVNKHCIKGKSIILSEIETWNNYHRTISIIIRF